MSRHSTTIGASCEVCDCVGGVENELKSHSVIDFLKVIFSPWLEKSMTTLDSGIDVAPRINVASGTFCESIKCSP